MKNKIIKVLGFTSNGGAKYHRVSLPLQELEKRGLIDIKIVDIKNLKENIGEIFADVDIVYNNWLSPFDTVTWSLWKEKYKFKFVLDLDDTINNEGYMEYYKDWVNLVVFADYVSCTNPLLGLEISRYNKNIFILQNYIPIGKGQFINKPKEKEFKEGLLRVGLIGSESHIKNFLTLKGVLNKLAKNKEIVNKCEFVICGYEDSTKWSYVINMFKKKKNLKLELHKSKYVNSYMELYNELDVVLAPLEQTFFNSCRSGLKVIEASVKGCIVLGSPLYGQKEFPNTLVANTPKDYEDTLVDLLQLGEFKRVSEELSSANIALNDWEGRMKYTMELFELVSNLETTDLPEDVEIHSIKYLDSQVVEYIPYDNSAIKTIEQKSYLMEYNVFNDLVPKFKDDGYYSVFSWKFPFKTGYYKKAMGKILEEIGYKDYDVINLCQPLDKPYLEFTEEQHPGFMELFNLVCKDLNLEVKEPKHTVYSNFFLAKGGVYKEYLTSVLQPAIELMETKYKDLAWKDADYKSGLPKEQLQEATGMEYYPFHAFILERLFSVWIDNKELKVYE